MSVRDHRQDRRHIRLIWFIKPTEDFGDPRSIIRCATVIQI